MINDFLKKYQEELISEKIQLKEDMDLLETKIKEESKFLNLLEESNESYFKEFTPRDLNSKNNKKAAEIRDYLVDLNSQLDEKTAKMKFYEDRLSEIADLISNSVFDCKPTIDMSVENYSADDDLSVQDSTSDNNTSQIHSEITNSDLIASLLNIKDLILLDPYRAQIELEKIISTI